MGLSRSLFANAARSVFNVAGDAVKTGLYHEQGNQTYNPRLGKKESRTRRDFKTGALIGEPKDHPIKAIEESFETSQFDGDNIKTGDIKFIILQDDLDVKPTQNEYVTLGGVKYRVMGVKKDMMAVAWVLHCRA